MWPLNENEFDSPALDGSVQAGRSRAAAAAAAALELPAGGGEKTAQKSKINQSI